MSRYVDIEPYEEYILQRHYRNSMGECIETVPLCGLPIADVQEVRHGRWEKDNDTAFFWKCSECGAYLFWRKEEYLLRDTDEPNYCPNCGAKMDEGGDTE